MNICSPRWVLGPGALALFVSLGAGGAATAADQPARVAAPTMIPDPGVPCATCTNPPAPGRASSTCTTCGKTGCKHNSKPYVTQLCPGACFGYFQTQWHRWEDVCPLPYQGIGVSDAPNRSPAPVAGPPALKPTTPTAPVTPAPDPKAKGSDIPLPKPNTLPRSPTELNPPPPPKTTPNLDPIPPLPRY